MMSQKSSGTFKFNGVEYKCSVVDGVRYINGLSVNDWIDELSPRDLQDFAVVGQRVMQDMKNGVNTPHGALQEMLNERHSSRNN